jgi:hypothetical protein
VARPSADAHPDVLVGVLSVLALVALFIPRAQVDLDPVRQTQSIEIPVNASPSVQRVFITGNIPAREKRIVVKACRASV